MIEGALLFAGSEICESEVSVDVLFVDVELEMREGGVGRGMLEVELCHRTLSVARDLLPLVTQDSGGVAVACLAKAVECMK